MIPYIHEAFTQLHLGQLFAIVKCVSRDRRDGGINPDTDHIVRSFPSSSSRVDEDAVAVGSIRHGTKPLKTARNPLHARKRQISTCGRRVVKEVPSNQATTTGTLTIQK